MSQHISRTFFCQPAVFFSHNKSIMTFQTSEQSCDAQYMNLSTGVFVEQIIQTVNSCSLLTQRAEKGIKKEMPN